MIQAVVVPVQEVCRDVTRCCHVSAREKPFTGGRVTSRSEIIGRGQRRTYRVEVQEGIQTCPVANCQEGRACNQWPEALPVQRAQVKED